jgi:hypothetical protein
MRAIRSSRGSRPKISSLRSIEPAAAPSMEVMSIFTAQPSVFSSLAGAASAASPRRNLPGFGASFGSAFFTASRTKIQPPDRAGHRALDQHQAALDVGLHDAQVLRRHAVVPMWPAIFLFLKVLPGS